MMIKSNDFRNWQLTARQANWSVRQLAKQLRVSVRTLEHDFVETMGVKPKAWLTEQRQMEAMKLLLDGFSVKETALRLNYSHTSTFSREFKKHWGKPPIGVMPSVRVKLERLTHLA